MAVTSYALAFGANRFAKGGPATTIERAIAALNTEGVTILACSRIIASHPMGPGTRHFANAAALVETDLAPPSLLTLAKAIEHRLGRRPGRRWGDRAIDIDIILWSGGMWADGALVIPHPEFRTRRFVLDPLAEIAPDWRDPMTGCTMRQLHRRAAHAIPVDRRTRRP